MTDKQLRYIGTTDEQVRYKNFDDPRGLLVEGQTYAVLREEIHSWYTNIILVNFPDKRFNSVSFKEVHVTDKPEIQRYRFIVERDGDGIASAKAAPWFGSQTPENDYVHFPDLAPYVAAKVKEAVEKVRREEVDPLLDLASRLHLPHFSCDDPWYSCPKSPEGCCNDNAGTECNCDADRTNNDIDTVVAAVRKSQEVTT